MLPQLSRSMPPGWTQLHAVTSARRELRTRPLQYEPTAGDLGRRLAVLLRPARVAFVSPRERHRPVDGSALPAVTRRLVGSKVRIIRRNISTHKAHPVLPQSPRHPRRAADALAADMTRELFYGRLALCVTARVSNVSRPVDVVMTAQELMAEC